MASRPIQGRPCPRCGSTQTKQLTNFGRPMRGRFQCWGPECRRSWDEVHETAPDYVAPKRKSS